MSELNIERARFNMIEQQVRPWEVLDQRVLDVMSSVPREQFVPPDQRAFAFADVELPLDSVGGPGEVMLSPKLVGRLLQALDPQPRDSVLEIGTGSGYVTACLARLAAQVHSVERIAELRSYAQQRLSDLAIENCTLRTGDALELGGFDGQRFDVIAVTGALYEIPPLLREALNPDGRLFVVTGEPPVMEARLLTRVSAAGWSDESLFETSLPYLHNGAKPVRFLF